jgi:hypothetical protein
MKHDLKKTVTIVVSGETGEVIGRAEYVYAEPSYLVRYKDADGRAVESWWTESALE